MDQPPICSYEGSDYMATFWEKGGREYEDAVEQVALARLLPPGGKLLLELGAGAGRNTPRYQNFERVVLLDFSLTQLQQARQRLGEAAHYTYVAADIYRLPFVEGLFDAATMIRTLHHMADPRRALNEVRQVLQGGATFILEYANKKNLKAILRYTFHRQEWSPFSPEPVEFAALNFDFHPSTVHAWLRQNGFAIERQLAVSQFRVGFLKRHVPLGLLVKMDSWLQPAGNWWTFSPSLFVRARTLGENMQTGMDGFFRCPGCRHAPLVDTQAEITCPQCGRRYPVVDGIYDFRMQ